MTSDGGLDGDDARRRLYEVMRSDDPFEERAERALEIGRRYLGVRNGHVAAIDPEEGRWEVVASTAQVDGDFPPGLVLNLSTTYCRRTIREDDPIALHDAPEQGWADDPAFETHGLRCYHGTPISVRGELFGTACFVDETAREPFTDEERTFTDLVARMLGHALERERHETAVAERERELRERTEWLRSIVEASSDVIFRLDPDGTFTFVSEPVVDLLGYTPRELQGRSVSTLLPDGEPSNRGTAAFRRVIDGESVEVTDLPLSTADGGTVHADVRAAPVYATDGPDADRVVSVQGIVRDVTERRRHEQVIQVLNRVLRHNLRNDMSVIRGVAEGLREELDGERAALADQIVATSDGLMELSETARKLETAFDEGPSPQPVDLVVLVERAVERVRRTYPEATIRLSTVEEAVVRASPAVETAVHELVGNAARHAGASPTVDVEVRTAGEGVAVAVSDDGPGLPSQDRTVLETGDEGPLHHGSGLGLWLVYWLVSSLDGDVEASVTGAGTTVTIRLAEARTPEDSLASVA